MPGDFIINARSMALADKTMSKNQPAECSHRTTVRHIKSQLRRFSKMAEGHDLEFLDSALRIAILECDELLAGSIDDALHDSGNAFSNSIANRQSPSR